MKGLMTVVGGVVFGIPADLLLGVVLRDQWRWFVMPLGVPAIGVVQAVGLCMVLRLLNLDISEAYHRESDEKVEGRWWKTPGITAVVALMSWGFGYLWHLAL